MLLQPFLWDLISLPSLLGFSSPFIGVRQAFCCLEPCGCPWIFLFSSKDDVSAVVPEPSLGPPLTCSCPLSLRCQASPEVWGPITAPCVPGFAEKPIHSTPPSILSQVSPMLAVTFEPRKGPLF